MMPALPTLFLGGLFHHSYVFTEGYLDAGTLELCLTSILQKKLN